jgi:UDP-3-O-acyl N-acetylglucosamine deacetylase
MKTLDRLTLRSPVTLVGAGLHSGLTTTLKLLPAEAGASITFVRVDLQGAPEVRVTDVDRNAPPFRTALKKGNADVHTVEHLLSALAALGITDCRIEIDNPEIPGMDGSALDFFHAVQSVGTKPVYGQTLAPLVVEKNVSVEDGIARIKAEPNPEGGLKIRYRLYYPGQPLLQGTQNLDFTTDSFYKEIAPARTFAPLKDAEQMRAAGLGKGANTQNTVIVDGEKVIETTLRFSNEPTRHKILDLIGDLYILGRPVHGIITAECSGHKINRMLALKLAETHL